PVRTWLPSKSVFARSTPRYGYVSTGGAKADQDQHDSCREPPGPLVGCTHDPTDRRQGKKDGFSREALFPGARRGRARSRQPGDARAGGACPLLPRRLLSRSRLQWRRQRKLSEREASSWPVNATLDSRL